MNNLFEYESAESWDDTVHFYDVKFKRDFGPVKAGQTFPYVIYDVERCVLQLGTDFGEPPTIDLNCEITFLSESPSGPPAIDDSPISYSEDDQLP